MARRQRRGDEAPDTTGVAVVTRWAFWAGTVGFATPVLDRLDAARTLDVQCFSITPLDVEWAASEGIGASELGLRIRDAGFEIAMDPLVGWYGGTPHPGSRFGRFSPDDVLRMSAEVGATDINMIGQPTHDASLDLLATSFAAVCDRAADIGARAMLEFTPITAITNLADGWDVVRTADRPNGGMLFDTWHFSRGDADLDLLASIPGDRFFHVQVADARAERLPDIRQDTQHRALPRRRSARPRRHPARAARHQRAELRGPRGLLPRPDGDAGRRRRRARRRPRPIRGRAGPTMTVVRCQAPLAVPGSSRPTARGSASDCSRRSGRVRQESGTRQDAPPPDETSRDAGRPDGIPTPKITRIHPRGLEMQTVTLRSPSGRRHGNRSGRLQR